MSRRLKTLLFATGFLAATGIEAARAAEAFLCEGGRIVYVAVGKLEEMKRTDACIAGYFGLPVPPGPVSATADAAGAGPAAAPQAAPPDAPETVSAAPAANAASPAPQFALRRLDLSEPASTRPPEPRRVAGAALPLRAADGTDYRNVVVINAEDGASAIYRHER